MQQPILIVAPARRNKETVKRLARVGYDNSIGYLKGGFEAWKQSGKENRYDCFCLSFKRTLKPAKEGLYYC